MDRFPITLIVLPGNGASSLTVDAGTTIGQLFTAKQLTDRSAVVNGSTQDMSYVLKSGDEVAALKNTKGA